MTIMPSKGRLLLYIAGLPVILEITPIIEQTWVRIMFEAVLPEDCLMLEIRKSQISSNFGDLTGCRWRLQGRAIRKAGS